MAKNFQSLYSSKNVELFNLLFRHQAYLEGVKGGMAIDYQKMLTALYAEFGKYMFEVRYSNMNAFTKGELLAFIYKFTRAQITFYSQFTQQLIDLLKAFAADDVTVSSAIMQHVTGLTIAQAEALRDHDTTLGYAVVDGSENANDQLWEKIANDPIPANGLLVASALKSLQDAHTSQLIALLKMGWANGWTFAQLRVALYGADNVGYSGVNDSTSVVGSGQVTDTGDASQSEYTSPELWNSKTGLMGKWLAQGVAQENTILQHVSNVTQSAVSSVYFNQYQWVSIMDSRTTAVCWGRNGNVYTYGVGPIPPAHYNCRSKIVALLGEHDAMNYPTSFRDWMMTQPAKVQNDILGSRSASKLRAGGYTDSSLQIGSAVRPLTITDFTSKIESILQ